MPDCCCPDVTYNIVGAWPPTSSDNNFNMSRRCCSCTQSTTVRRRASTFSSSSFLVELLGLSCFTKKAEYCLDFQIPCLLPMHSYCISQLRNNLCPVFFLKILWWSQSGDYLAKFRYDENNRVLLYSLLPPGTYHKKSGEFGQISMKSFSRLKFDKNLPIKKHWLSPNVHFKSRKVNFIAWQSSKLGRSEPAPTKVPCLGWIVCGIDNSLVYASVAPFLVFRRTLRSGSRLFSKMEAHMVLSVEDIPKF